MDEKNLYKLDDNILFRKCSLFDGASENFGDCTDFHIKTDFNGVDYYSCNQLGLHYHCAKHPEIELERLDEETPSILTCPKCKNELDIGSIRRLRSQCLRALNRPIFKDAKLIRINDWYIPEIKERIKPTSDYRVITEVKTEKDGDTMVVIYITHAGTDGKSQLFIKPEKLQLSHDFKDLDPAKVLSKIELTLKDRTITQEYAE